MFKVLNPFTMVYSNEACFFVVQGFRAIKVKW
jgi:hypothetical protein